MRAMILAAGRGERMRPLTNTISKAMLEVNGRPLIQYQVEYLVQAGIREIVINHAISGDQIENYLGDGHHFNANISYSAEMEPLETGGGIYKALPLLGDDPFIAINADVWTDFPLQQLPTDPDGHAHLVLVDNPPHHPAGDFALEQGRVRNKGNRQYTFSGIGVYRRELFSHCVGSVFPLVSVLRPAISDSLICGEYYGGNWIDVGTPERLEALRKQLHK
ncbi:MAG: mannose-1-phosphate guanylyltransferase [Gammaproteobacteria bacterium]|nr:mannose-1-phosphate guanylyltransferase [Gammaproteobacteria bacterium]